MKTRTGGLAMAAVVMCLFVASCGHSGSSEPTRVGSRVDGSEPVTVTSSRPAVGHKDADQVVLFNDGFETFRYKTLSELGHHATVVAKGEIADQFLMPAVELQDGTLSSRRISVVSVDTAIKGTKVGDDLRVFDATLEQDPDRETGKPGPRILTTWTEGYDLQVGDRVVIALIPQASSAGIYAVDSSSAYFLIDHDGSVVPTARRNPAAEKAQDLSLDEIIAELSEG